MFNEELTNKHFAFMRKLYHEKVLTIENPKERKEVLNELSSKEIEWLKNHPDCRRYFSALNDEYNPMRLTFPDPNTMPCKGCVFAEKDGESKAFCQVYRYPNMKPNNILWGKNAKCEYKVSEKKTQKSKKKD